MEDSKPREEKLSDFEKAVYGKKPTLLERMRRNRTGNRHRLRTAPQHNSTIPPAPYATEEDEQRAFRRGLRFRQNQRPTHISQVPGHIKEKVVAMLQSGKQTVSHENILADKS